MAKTEEEIKTKGGGTGKKKETFREILVFSGSSNPALGKEITELLAQKLKVSLDEVEGEVELSRFSNGEIYVKYKESVRGTDVFVVQTLCEPVNDLLMELLVMIDALKRASARRINAVIPHYGYSRQDKKTKSREPITAKLVADLLTTAGIDRMVSMDLHAGQIQGFFDIPVDHLLAGLRLADYFKGKFLRNLVVVSPDVGRVKVAKKYADMLEADLAVLHKVREEVRPAHNEPKMRQVVGEVAGKTVLLVDDMVDTAGTITEAALTLEEEGAKEIYACATHPILSGNAVRKLAESPIKEIAFTNTLPIPEKKKLPNFTVLSVASLFAETIYNIHKNLTVAGIFGDDNQV